MNGHRLHLPAAWRTLLLNLLVVVIACAAVGFATAQPEAGVATEAQNPGPINTFEFDGGRLFNRRPGEKDESYYRLSYKGALVREQGTPFKHADALDLAAPVLAPAESGSGDRNKWSLRYENGRGALGGGLFEATGVQPFPLRGLEALDLRGTAGLASDGDGKNVRFAVGLESAPWRLPGLRNREVSNWVVIGVNAQRQRAAAPDTVNNQAVLTYRAFVGKAFGWRKSADVGKTAAKLERDLLQQAPTLADGKVLSERIGKIPANQRSGLQDALRDVVQDAKPNDEWVKLVRNYALGEADAITDQPTLAVYAESTGWYTASGEAVGKRFKHLFTMSVDYWFMPGRDDVFARLRYENGHEWVLPLQKKDQLKLSVGLRF